MKEMVHLKEDGSFKLDMKYFSYDHGLRMTNGAFDDFFGGPPRKPETWMSEREFDIAASVQKVCEEVVLQMARHLHQETGPDEALHGRRRRAQLRGQRPGHPRDAVRRTSGSSRRPATRAGRWASPHYIYNTIHEAAPRHGLDPRLPRPAVHGRRDRPVPRRGGGEVRRRSPTRSWSRRTARAHLRERAWSAGSRAGWSSARGRWAPAASSPTRATRRCTTPST